MRIILFLTAVFALSISDIAAQENEDNLIRKTGKATYYHSKFVGRKTSNGQIYRHEKLTAAHKTLPFGTEVTVTNPKNGKFVTVVINDRGPFHKHLMIDLSQSAAKELDIYKLGVATVEISYRLPNKEKLAKKETNDTENSGGI